jgi:hypothetical protein
MNDYERTVLRNVEAFGWHCTSVTQEDEGDDPPFTYTVGLFKTFGAPEIIMFGLSQDVAHSILSIYARRLEEKNPISVDAPCPDLINNYSCVFVPVPRPRYNDFVFSALWFYAEVEFPLYQLVWPNKEGRFPWHPRAAAAFKSEQPFLGSGGGA